jgi:hypothetical protein
MYPGHILLCTRPLVATAVTRSHGSRQLGGGDPVGGNTWPIPYTHVRTQWNERKRIGDDNDNDDDATQPRHDRGARPSVRPSSLSIQSHHHHHHHHHSGTTPMTTTTTTTTAGAVTTMTLETIRAIDGSERAVVRETVKVPYDVNDL